MLHLFSLKWRSSVERLHQSNLSNGPQIQFQFLDFFFPPFFWYRSVCLEVCFQNSMKRLILWRLLKFKKICTTTNQKHPRIRSKVSQNLQKYDICYTLVPSHKRMTDCGIRYWRKKFFRISLSLGNIFWKLFFKLLKVFS